MTPFQHYLQIAAIPDLEAALYVYGPLGIFCLYFMYRDEKREKSIATATGATQSEIRALSHRINGMSKALILDVLSRPGLGDTARRMGEEMLATNGSKDGHGPE